MNETAHMEIKSKMGQTHNCTLRKRLQKRSAEARDPSEADESVLDAQIRRAEPPSGEEMRFVQTIDREAQ